MQTKVISIIIPCRNEEQYISKCLNSVNDFLIPKDVEIEIFVIDGESTDRTLRIVEDFIHNDNRIKILKNPDIFQANALNIGISQSSGAWIMRLDAHTIYPKTYLMDLYNTAIETNAENCGGQLKTLPGGTNYGASLVQALTTHSFGVGDSSFRTDAKPGEVDTVPFGFFKRKIFDKIGLFNEKLVRAQDYEFNRRILKYGYKIWMNPDIKCTYYNQSSLLKFYKKQIFKEAPYNAYMWFLAPYTFAYRHAITGAFALGIIGGLFLSLYIPIIKFIFVSVLVLYFCLSILSSFQQAIRYKMFLHMVALPICFFLFHFLHGVGVLSGIIRILSRTTPFHK